MAENVIPLRPGSLGATFKADTGATAQTGDALIRRRVGAIVEATEARPKMSTTDTATVATNLDRMLRDFKRRVLLGELCRKVGIGDGCDPKALYNYRLPPDTPASSRKLIQDARKYRRIVDELSALAGEDETRLLRELFRGTSYHEDATPHSNAALDLVELLEGMAYWISRTTRLTAAFAAAKTERAVIRTQADGGRYCVLDWFLGSVDGLPEVPLCFQYSSLDVDSLPGLQATTSDGRQIRLCEREAVFLLLAPDERGAPRPIIRIDRDCGALIGSDYAAVEHWTASRDSIQVQLKGGCQLSVRFQGLAEEWDRLEADGQTPEDDVHQSFPPLEYFLLVNDGNSNPASAEKLERLAHWVGDNEVTLSSFIMQWIDSTVTHGRGLLPRLLNGFDSRQVQCPREKWEMDPRLARMMARRSPEGGWAVTAPTPTACSLPDLMWLLADEYAELVLNEIALTRSREDHERINVLRRMRGEV